MAESSRVEELRKRYHENPRRFFAPLANEYRKTGFLDRALLLCEKHLAEQPGNMNGLIVYGQTLFESGRQADARAPFEAALELDPENLIALRHLGDVARLGEDHESARKWYQRVLEFDRRNDEVMDLLEQVGGTPREPVTGPSARPSTIRLAANVSAVPPDDSHAMGGFIDLEGPSAPKITPAAPAATTAPAKPALDAAFQAAKTVETTPRSLASAKTLEIPRTPTPAPRRATPAPGSTPPPRRASLLDINFDFGEMGSADSALPPKPAAPLMDSEAAEYGFAAALPSGPSARPAPASAEPVKAESFGLPELEAEFEAEFKTEEPLELSSRPSTDTPLFELPPEPVSLGSSAPGLYVHPDPSSVRDSASLIDLPPEPSSVGDVARIAGLEAADYESDVAPLSDLEPMDFVGDGGTTAPLAEFESTEFEAPADRSSIPSMPGLELPEFMIDLPEPAPEPAPAPAPEPVAAPAQAPTFVTETMAELYLEQGFRAQAVEVYRKLTEQEPGNDAIRRKLAALESVESVESVEAVEAARQSMEFETPSEVPTVLPEQPPANAMLSEMSFDDLALQTPVSNVRVPTPVAAIPVPSGPTAREFFAAFSRRAAQRTPVSAPVITPSYAIPAALSPLDQIFGIEATEEDQRAANLLASMGTTSAPTGSSSLDALFTIGGSAPAPRASVSRASEKLKFDQFFSASSSPAQESRPATPAPAAEPVRDRPPGDDDLDQFQGWLKGLTQ